MPGCLIKKLFLKRLKTNKVPPCHLRLLKLNNPSSAKRNKLENLLVTTATVATTTAATTTTAETASTTAAAAAFFTRTCFVDCEATASNVLAGELRNGFLRFCIGRHRHKREPAGLAGFAINHQGRFGHVTCRGKEALEFSLGRVEGKIPYV